MKQSIFKNEYLITVLTLVFLFITFEFGINFNFEPSRYIVSHPIQTIVEYYSEALPHLQDQFMIVNFHWMSGVILLILGWTQLNEKIRIKHKRLHRFSGILYMIVGLSVVLVGLKMSSRVLGGLTTQISFILTSFFWITSAALSIRAMLNKKFYEHRLWSVRNFAMTLSTGLIRPILFIVNNIFPDEKISTLFQISCWLAMVTGLVLGQFLTERKK